MQSNFILNDIKKDILMKYRECIKNHFIIKTLEQGIVFRHWNCLKFYTKPSNNIHDIIKVSHKCNLKIVYNNEDFFNINL
jgi:hypothetical protein